MDLYCHWREICAMLFGQHSTDIFFFFSLIELHYIWLSFWPAISTPPFNSIVMRVELLFTILHFFFFVLLMSDGFIFRSCRKTELNTLGSKNVFMRVATRTRIYGRAFTIFCVPFNLTGASFFLPPLYMFLCVCVFDI